MARPKLARPKFRTEQEVNDYYDERGFKIENKYYSRIRYIDGKMLENEEDIAKIEERLESKNAPLLKKRDKLLEEYQEETQPTTELEKQMEIERNRWYLLSEVLSKESDPEKRREIEDSMRDTAGKMTSIESNIKDAKQQDFERRQKLWSDIQDTNAKINADTRKLEKIAKIEADQDQRISKKDEIAEKFDSDIQRNERLRQQAIDNLPKTVPDRVVDVDGYAWTDYCDGGRIITVPIKFSIRLPDELTIQDIPQDILQQMATEAYDYVTIDMGEIVPGGLMLWSDIKPTGAGDYHFGDRGIAYNRTEVIEPEYDGYRLTSEGYIKTG